MSSARISREDDKNKQGSSGLGIAAAAAVVGVGIGVGAALYYLFKPAEVPHTSNSRAEQRKLDQINAEIFRQRTWTLESCSICLDVMLSEDEEFLLPKCGHKFHANCVRPWIENNNTCPNCRKPI